MVSLRSRRESVTETVHRSSLRRGGRRRRGAAIVEFAVVAPVFILLVLGIIEIGRAVMVQQILTNASREGVRNAIVEGATSDEVQDTVTNYLSNSSITGATVDVSPVDLTSVGFGTPVTVTVSVPFDGVTWVPGGSIMAGKTLSASSVMRGERLQ